MLDTVYYYIITPLQENGDTWRTEIANYIHVRISSSIQAGVGYGV